MIGFDIFNNDAFSAVSMTQAVDKMGHVPSFLRKMAGLYVPVPVRTEMVMIEQRENAPALIQTDLRGAPPKRKAGDTRSARAFKTVRLAQSSRIMATSLQNIRAFGSETELQAMQVEIARRQKLLTADIDLTEENLFLGMVQGLVKDADGSTLYDWATEFGQNIPAEIDFDLDAGSPASGAVRKKCNEVVRSIVRGLDGLGGEDVAVHALCGDAFWDDLTAHSEVRQTYLNTMAAQELRGQVGRVFQSFVYGDIVWHNYRGTDGSAVRVPTNEAKFFPVGAGIFQMAYSPGESFDFVNTLGMPRYSMMVLDRDRNAWADVEVYSYPLPVCVQPKALHRARRT